MLTTSTTAPYSVLTTSTTSAYPMLILQTPYQNRSVTQTTPIVASTPSPTATITPTIQFLSRNDGWVEFRNSQIGYVVAFTPGSYFQYSEWPPNSNLYIDDVLIWFKAENVSPALGIQINTIRNTEQLSAAEYFSSHDYLSNDPKDFTIKNATEVDFQGIKGIRFLTMAIADQYIILVPYKDYLVELTVLYGGPAGPYEMTSSDNQFMNDFLRRLTFN